MIKKRKTEEGIRILEQGAWLLQRTLGPESRDLGVVCHNIAVAYGRDNKVEESLSYFTQALQILETRGTPEEVTRCQKHLAEIMKRKKETASTTVV